MGEREREREWKRRGKRKTGELIYSAVFTRPAPAVVLLAAAQLATLRSPVQDVRVALFLLIVVPYVVRLVADVLLTDALLATLHDQYLDARVVLLLPIVLQDVMLLIAIVLHTAALLLTLHV